MGKIKLENIMLLDSHWVIGQIIYEVITPTGEETFKKVVIPGIAFKHFIEEMVNCIPFVFQKEGQKISGEIKGTAIEMDGERTFIYELDYIPTDNMDYAEDTAYIMKAIKYLVSKWNTDEVEKRK